MQQRLVVVFSWVNITSYYLCLAFNMTGSTPESTPSSSDKSPGITEVMSLFEKKLDSIAVRLDSQVDLKISLLEKQMKECMHKELSVMFIRLKAA